MPSFPKLLFQRQVRAGVQDMTSNVPKRLFVRNVALAMPLICKNKLPRLGVS